MRGWWVTGMLSATYTRLLWGEGWFVGLVRKSIGISSQSGLQEPFAILKLSAELMSAHNFSEELYFILLVVFEGNPLVLFVGC
uniref:Uncharacterized protein n=1 Tax=Candidatus Kentrum sp. TC TaxID=2126339 RepID=A0A450YTA9_9GAMM|nr:MAG: hypothetical protein BECKTC1821D_GA0114238_10219 [Candidatus Kentron sp. TC]